jgi:hypothetical protein
MSHRLTRILILACLCLALTATAAQANPHRFQGHGPHSIVPASPIAQQKPANVVVTKGGYSYLDTVVGAAIAAGLVGAGTIAVRRWPRRSQVA